METVNATSPSIPTANVSPVHGDSAFGNWFGRIVAGELSNVAFVLFVLANGVLFIRPMDIVPRLENWPVFGVLSGLCLIFSFRQMLDHLTWRSLRVNPITACVILLLPAVILSQLAHLRVSAAINSGGDFFRWIFYYLLLVAVIDSPQRLRRFLWFVGFCAFVHIGLAVLQQRFIIDLAAMRPVEEQKLAATAGEIITQYRMCGAGLFHDPNDLAVLAATTMMLCLYPIIDGAGMRGRARWTHSALAAIALMVCGYGLLLTQSRGGFLALLAGLGAFFFARFGWKKSIVLGAIALPVILILFSGRQTDIHMMRRTTTQLRLKFWVEGLSFFTQSPLFGIGQGNFLKLQGYVAHNSFVHCFAELGFLGGTLFLGAFFLAVWPIFWMQFNRSAFDHEVHDIELDHLRPYLFAMLCTWVAGMMSLSRSYVPPTYMMLGLAAVLICLVIPATSPSRPRINRTLILQLLGLSFAFLGGVFVFVHLFKRN
ncbi:MAG TPA: O-antigen ligase family protein [Tepidisphaeraceae bacterium]|nr:O-antigen ligase family protein [Tepidisphaeraceae bacterium]